MAQAKAMRLLESLHISGDRDSARRSEDGLDEARRQRENRVASIFLLGFLAFCGALALADFGLYVWVIELACGFVYIAIFMFAFSIKDYSQDTSMLHSSTGFLFTFAFEAAYFYVIARSGSRDFRLAPEGFFLWISTQWYLAFTLLIAIDRKAPKISLARVIAICSVVAAAIFAAHFLLGDLELLLETRYPVAFLGTNAAGLACIYGFIAFRLRRAWGELPEYYARRILASVLASILSCGGILLTIDSAPAAAFAFYYLRFVAVSLCYSANVTYILLSPFRALYGQLSSRAEELSESLAEREILLKEIHHRVKNNLQVISSLLSLQAFYRADERLARSLGESQSRIRAMALVHEMLYQSEDFAAVDFSDYLKRIVSELFSACGRPEIRSVLDCETLRVPIDAAITCGLIVNELVGNSLKHAFPEGRGGTIRVSLKASSSLASIEVDDDGVGLPPGFDIRELRTMGLSLLEGLTAQLDGEYSIDGSLGTRIIVSFPNESP
jgi:two-component sensor histidine kinase